MKLRQSSLTAISTKQKEAPVRVVSVGAFLGLAEMSLIKEARYWCSGAEGPWEVTVMA